MAMCSICGKRRRAGKNVRHTNRWFLPNVQKAKIMVDGRTQRVALCTRCLRTAQNKRLAI
jgi:large subunit ribosomal protein L28